MGLIKALVGSTAGTFGDQWKEYFYCESIPVDVLMVKGQKRVNAKRSSNTKGVSPSLLNCLLMESSDVAVFTLCCTLLLSGCAAWNLQTKQSDPNAEALPVIETIPWAAHQTASYVIYNSKGEEYGTAEIDITVDLAAQTCDIQKTKSYEDETVIESGVTIAMDTLMPLSSL